jgi:hypothetical protein
MDATIEMDITGIEGVIKKLDKLKDIAHDLAAGMFVLAEQVLTESKDLVPVDVGTLKASGYVEAPRVTPDRVTVRIGYGGAAHAYAWNQEYGGWINLVAWGHEVGPYWPMHHPPKWVAQVLANPNRHSARVVARAVRRMGSQIGQMHFLEEPFFAAAPEFRAEMEAIVAAKLIELGK